MSTNDSGSRGQDEKVEQGLCLWLMLTEVCTAWWYGGLKKGGSGPAQEICKGCNRQIYSAT